MYFASREQAGQTLATELMKKYRYENCAVVALNDGGVVVGAQIAKQLHCVLMLLQSFEINLPQEPEAVAGVTYSGDLVYNSEYSQGEIDEMINENRGLIDQEKLAKMHEANQLIGSGGTLDPNLLKGQNVILVADGIKTGFMLDLAYEFLKPVATDKLIVAVPLASDKAVNHMHAYADDLYCLSVVEDYKDTNHYYDKQDVPDHEAILQIIRQIILQWQ